MKTVKFLFPIALSLGVLFLSGCFKGKGPSVPAYIYVESIPLIITDASTQGSGSTNIKDAWITVDGQLIGTNNLPALLPVILDEAFTQHDIRIAAGILDNGITSTRTRYPFYLPYEITKELSPGEIDTLSPFVYYDSDATIRWIEDFDQNGISLGGDKDNNEDTFIEKTQEQVFEGTNSGKLIFDDSTNLCAVESSLQFTNLQPDGTSFPVYLEMDYRTDVNIEIALTMYQNSILIDTDYIGGVKSSTGAWKKVYFNFTERVLGTGADEFGLVFRSFKNDSVPDPNVYIDNIKLLHY